MSTDLDIPLPDTPFWAAYQGRFKGVLTWQAFDQLWDRLHASEQAFHVFDLSRKPSDLAATHDEFSAILDEARQMYEPVRRNSYCGAVYADDLENPSFIKVFDPYQMGGVCGDSGMRTLPRWVFSTIKPDPLPEAPEPAPRKSLLSRLTGA
jgi:hypothetical protein